MKRFNFWTNACSLFLLSAATAITLPAQTYTTLHSFNGTDGNNSQAALMQATNGDLYGSTVYAGANGVGTIFKMTTSGTVTLLRSFDGTDGSSPWNALVQDSDGNLYGTTNYGGADHACTGGCGTVYKATLGGTVTTLHSFDVTDGINPQAGLVFGNNGDFYGLTLYSGAYGYGTVFNVDPSGKLTTLHNFTDGTDGAYPCPAMILANDLNFYGVTYSGGAYEEGTVFKMTPSGTLTTLYAFCSDESLCPDGAEPVGGLVQGTDGNLYGVTGRGGATGCNCGTVFKITLGGALTTLHAFSGTDGNGPWTRMVQGTDGNFYGVTTYGGTSSSCSAGCGTIFSITPSGTFTMLYSFCPASGCADGQFSIAGLIQDTNGTFYGTTAEGGASGEGVIYSLSMGLGPFVKTQTTSGVDGSTVVILGTNLTGATGVTFNGTSATFTVVSSSEITAIVPAGATSGRVAVTLPGGTLGSNTNFQVVP